MTATIPQLVAAIAALPRAELELLALNVTQSLYLSTDVNNEPNEPIMDSEKEWQVETIEYVAGDLEQAGLMVEQIARQEAPKS